MIDTMTIDERTTYDSYTKEQVYEAYMLEVERADKLTTIMHRLERQLAKIRYEVNNDNSTT